MTVLRAFRGSAENDLDDMIFAFPYESTFFDELVIKWSLA